MLGGKKVKVSETMLHRTKSEGWENEEVEEEEKLTYEVVRVG